MAKRESKGQVVKTFKHFVPGTQLEFVDTQVKVYFQATTGKFTIWFPEHIGETISALPISRDERSQYSRDLLFFPHRGHKDNYSREFETTGHVTGLVMDRVVEGYKAVLEQFVVLMKNQQREKVILFSHAANLRWISNDDVTFSIGTAVTCADISFVEAPTLHLTYRVLWRVKDALYWLEDEGTVHERLRLHSSRESSRDKNAKIIAWTQEREDFLAHLKHSLEQLILRVREFSKDLEGNITAALEGRGAMAALAPPPKAIVTVEALDHDEVIDAARYETTEQEQPPVRVRERTRS